MGRNGTVVSGFARTVVVAAVVALTACGGPSNDVELEEGARNLDASLDILDQTGAASSLDDATPEQRACLEDGIVEQGIDTDDFLRAENTLDIQETVTRLLHECVPNIRELDSYLLSAGRTMDLAIGDGGTTTTDEVTCILDHIWAVSPDPITTFVRGDQPGDFEILGDAFLQCLPAERIDGALVDGDYGDDATHDALYDGCVGGDDRACDLLYLLSAPGSGYESITLDCAGRGIGPNDACSLEVNIDQATGLAPAGDPGVAALVDDCRAGDLLACDLAYQIASNEDPLAQVAFTCGDRVAIGGLPNCRTALADG